MNEQLSLFDYLRVSSISTKSKSWDLVGYCEIDCFASRAFSLIHSVPESLNLVDVNNIECSKIPDFDLLTYGFPCQPFSTAGDRLGFSDLIKGNLFFSSMAVVRNKKPSVLIAENVKGLLSHDRGNTFDVVLGTLSRLGYNNYYSVLNTCDFGLPQDRKRIFIVSIRSDLDNGSFSFPCGQPLKSQLSDFLVDDVADKYYLSSSMLSYINSYNDKYKVCDSRLVLNRTIASTITTRTGVNRADSSDYICKALPNNYNITHKNLSGLSVRKLIPLECWRLQGFTDEQFNSCIGISDSQLYKMAGNSISVPVVVALLESLYKSLPSIFDDLKVLSLFSGIGAFESGLNQFYSKY